MLASALASLCIGADGTNQWFHVFGNLLITVSPIPQGANDKTKLEDEVRNITSEHVGKHVVRGPFPFRSKVLQDRAMLSKLTNKMPGAVAIIPILTNSRENPKFVAVF